MGLQRQINKWYIAAKTLSEKHGKMGVIYLTMMEQKSILLKDDLELPGLLNIFYSVVVLNLLFPVKWCQCFKS